MRNLKTGVLLVVIMLFSMYESSAQEITKYDYLEVIVFQKMDNSGKVKRIEVNEQKSLEGKTVTAKSIEALNSTSGLLNYMNANNWEFVDRASITEKDSPIWLSYIFKKQK